MARFKHEGFTLVQEEKENHHYIIYDEEGDMRLHCAYEGGLFTQHEAERTIENYIAFCNGNDAEEFIKSLLEGEKK